MRETGRGRRTAWTTLMSIAMVFAADGGAVEAVGQRGILSSPAGQDGPVIRSKSNRAAITERAEAAGLDVEIPTKTDQVIISGKSMYIATDWTPPRTRPPAPGRRCWTHTDRRERDRTLAGHKGHLVADTFSTIGMELVREVWVADAADAVAIRLRVRNRRPDPIRLDALVPLHCNGARALIIAGTGAEDWEVLAQRRFKGGIPTSFGLGGEASTKNGIPIEMDPFCLVRRREQSEGPVLLAGYVSWLGHCARLLLQVKSVADRAELDYLTAECEFDGCMLPAGGERTSQWLLLRIGNDGDNLVADFADRVGRYHGIEKTPEAAPVVACSWYYYAREFGEKDLLENLDYLGKNRMEFDVLLIDDSWDRCWGNWLGNEKWPSGMKTAAEKIRAAGYRPGIWTCPFVVHPRSRPAIEHPEWMLRLEDGTLYTFGSARPNYILDPTYPGACEHLEEIFRRLRYDWGFSYFKLDFMQELVEDKRVRFYDRSATRLEAYRRGLEAIRRGVGPDAYVSVCGGHYGGSIGIANSQRSGSDVKPRGGINTKVIKQNILRTWMNRLWHVNPDSMRVRRPTDEGQQRLTDAEVRTLALNQYLGGGMVKLSFVFSELDDYSRSLYRHMIPSAGSSSAPLDPFESPIPSRLLTQVRPRCRDLEPWVTLAYINWSDKPQAVEVELSAEVVESMEGSRFLVFDFFSQKVLGIFELGARIDAGVVAPKGSSLLRIAPWKGDGPVLAGTDLHFSGGGVEITSWHAEAKEVTGRIETKWKYPVHVTVAFPTDSRYLVKTARLEQGQNVFRIAGP